MCYVSGSDCHGTPIQIRANKEGVSPQQIASLYHDEFKNCFEKLGFSFDLYNQTYDSFHSDFVQEFFTNLLDSGYIYKKTLEQAFCENCQQFLPDRFVVGKCPHCESDAKGDQCDSCGSLLEPSILKEIKCGICSDIPVFRPSTHFYLALSKLELFIKEYINGSHGWRANAVNLSQRYINEGLRDRAITRDLEWGISVPVKGFEGKSIYVWVEAVLGYLSASKKWALTSNWESFWAENTLHYYIHGKDNIPFHTIILPALLKAHGNFHLPDRIISSEYVTLEGRKISTSQNWAVWIPYLLENYHPDSIRYYFIANGPEKRDTDFSWREFIHSHNSELLGAYGNLVNRSLVFIQKFFENKVPEGQCDLRIKRTLTELYLAVGNLIEQGHFRDALDSIFSFIRTANKYFDVQQPWITVKDNIQTCREALNTCVQIIANLSILLNPFLPFSSDKIKTALNINAHDWSYIEVEQNSDLKPISILFERIDKKKIEEECEQLKNL